MGHAKVVASSREAIVVAMAMKTTAAAESPETASQDKGEALFGDAI
jgi:hypothetical protein